MKAHITKTNPDAYEIKGLVEAIEIYLARKALVYSQYAKYIFTEVGNLIYLDLFGADLNQLRLDRKSLKVRDTLNKDELLELQTIEFYSSKMIAEEHEPMESIRDILMLNREEEDGPSLLSQIVDRDRKREQLANKGASK